MPKFQNIRQNFSVGVLSPRLSARTDTDAFKNALKTGKNWIISSQGGAVLREGMQFIGYAANNAPFRLFQFLRGGEQSDILLEVTAGVTRYWVDDGDPVLYTDNVTILSDENDGELLTDENGEFLSIGVVTTANPYTDEDLDSLYFVNQDKYGIICSANHPPMYTTFRADGAVLSELLAPERIPYFDYNDVNSPENVSNAAGWRLNFPAGWLGSNFLYSATYNGVYGGMSGWSETRETNRAAIESMLLASAAAQGLPTTFTVSLVENNEGAFDVAVLGDDSGSAVSVSLSAGYSRDPSYISMQMPPVSQEDDPVLERAWSYPQWVLHNDRYYKCIRVHASTADTEPGVGINEDLYWVDLGIEKPNGFDYQFPDGNDWAVDHGTYAPMNRGFPTVPCFHQQRLIFMANKDNPTALYGSGINAYQDFLVGANDDEAWMFVLDSSDSPQIKWALSDRQLVIGTSSGEWVISAEVTITPTDIQAERQNASRSHLARPVQIDTEIFYVEQGNRKIRASSYVRQRGSFVSQNISIAAEHLISTYGVKRLCLQHVPEVMMVGVTGNGQFITMTYETLGENTAVQAFTEHTSDAEINDVASYFSIYQNRDSTYFAVKRNGNWLIERMRYPTSKEQEPLTEHGIVLMDSWINGEVLSLNGENMAVGLDHLNGKVVHILIDDAWIGVEEPVVNGRVMLPEGVTGTFGAGVPYMQDVDGGYAYGLLETFEADENIRGSGMGTKRRWVSLTTRLLNSALPKIFAKRDRDRTPAVPMGDYEGVREGTQDIVQTVQGYGDGSIRVVQDRPYPTHVVAFFGEYQVEDR